MNKKRIFALAFAVLMLLALAAFIYLRRAKDDAAVASSIENKRISAQV